ncbi:MAG: hypothetical protein ABI912_09950, partial [Actinomycetota bacterium]
EPESEDPPEPEPEPEDPPEPDPPEPDPPEPEPEGEDPDLGGVPESALDDPVAEPESLFAALSLLPSDEPFEPFEPFFDELRESVL